MKPIIDLLYPHREWLLTALLCAVLNLLSRRKSADEWEAWALQQPALALGIELLRAFGVDPKKMFVALKRYADRRAGNVPNDLWDGLPISPFLKDTLKDPAKRAAFEALIKVESVSPTATPTSAPALPPSSTPLG